MHDKQKSGLLSNGLPVSSIQEAKHSVCLIGLVGYLDLMDPMVKVLKA
jgi:hypothetical protein